MLKSVVAISLGAMLGALLRWGLGMRLNLLFPAIPPGTLASNLVGGYVVGVAVAFFGTATTVASTDTARAEAEVRRTAAVLRFLDTAELLEAGKKVCGCCRCRSRHGDAEARGAAPWRDGCPAGAVGPADRARGEAQGYRILSAGGLRPRAGPNHEGHEGTQRAQTEFPTGLPGERRSADLARGRLISCNAGARSVG